MPILTDSEKLVRLLKELEDRADASYEEGRPTCNQAMEILTAYSGWLEGYTK